jgi:hypothetical protein
MRAPCTTQTRTLIFGRPRPPKATSHAPTGPLRRRTCERVKGSECTYSPPYAPPLPPLCPPYATPYPRSCPRYMLCLGRARLRGGNGLCVIGVASATPPSMVIVDPVLRGPESLRVVMKSKSSTSTATKLTRQTDVSKRFGSTWLQVARRSPTQRIRHASSQHVHEATAYG